MINIFHNKKKIGNFYKDEKYILEYQNFELENSISLSLPTTQKFYIFNEFVPFFDMFLPEGYLYEILKNYLTKLYGIIDDYSLFKFLAPGIDGRIKFSEKKDFKSFNLELEHILLNDSNDTFNYLLKTFLNKNAISGVQPKTVAILKDKESLKFKNYIIKAWGDEFKYLAENEYLCLKTIEFANIKIPKIYLSENKNFLVIERFDSEFIGFEEVLSILGNLRIFKYNGSYEKVAKVISKFLSDLNEMKYLFKLIVMNYLLKNGDAHLKNFGLLFKDDFSEIFLAPAYDVVNTTAYFYKDKPALTLFGKKIWWDRENLIKFGIKYCYLKEKEAKDLYDECIEATKKGIEFIKEYTNRNPHFEKIAKRMIDAWSIDNEKKLKELPYDIIRAW